ncbi:MAG: multicomponent Na+:H+ antiporter subunit C [Candidatus Marinamargulisbacteria bacterium]|jgi:multicomponent Na+:H+ antiporter subunit C
MDMKMLVDNYNFVVVVILFVLGLWAMIAKKNLIKKCIGMAIFQTAIILFYISMGAKHGSTIPIIEHAHGGHGAHDVIEAAHYANPLTQILMLTAIVVGVATLGVALALIQNIYRQYGTINEDRILEKLK